MTTLSGQVDRANDRLAARPKVRLIPVTRTRRTRSRIDSLLTYIGLLLVCAGFIFPFVWMLSTSFKTVAEAMKPTIQLIPVPFVPGNYTDVLTNPKIDFPAFARNTLIIALLAVMGTTISSAV